MDKKWCLTTIFSVLFVVIATPWSFADVFIKERQAELLYGKGVHAFFDGDFQTSAQLLTQVEQLQSEDPRPYFFLGLSYLRTNQNSLAENMLRKAAHLEWEGRSARDFAVSDALRRIQGTERTFVEKFRQEARENWQKAEKRRRLELYGRERDQDRAILQTLAKPFVGPAPFGARSVDPFPAASNEQSQRVIQVEDTIPAATAPTAGGTLKSTEKSDLQTATDTEDMESEEKAEVNDDPFAAPVPKTEAPKTEPKPAKDNDPFADDEDDDPFAAPAPKTETPKTEPKPAKDNDPFADDDDDPFAAPAPKTEAPKTELKPAKDNDPFADDDDDPFADSDAGKMTTESKTESKKEESEDDADEEEDPFQ